jgi:hypothetical protein
MTVLTWGRQRGIPAPNPAVQFSVDKFGLLSKTSAEVMENWVARESQVLLVPDVVILRPEM